MATALERNSQDVAAMYEHIAVHLHITVSRVEEALRNKSNPRPAPSKLHEDRRKTMRWELKDSSWSGDMIYIWHRYHYECVMIAERTKGEWKPDQGIEDMIIIRMFDHLLNPRPYRFKGILI